MRRLAPAGASLAEHAARLLPHAQALTPEGHGPFPVVVQMHGCGGLERKMQARYAQAGRAVGVAVVIVDSLTPRGIGPLEAGSLVCTGLRLRGAERARDLLAMLAWLETQPWADVRRVAAAGWSHGGWAIMEALASTRDADGGGDTGAAALEAALLFYPYAGPLAARTHRHGWGDARPKVHAWLAGRDTVVGRLAPRRAIERLRSDGLEVTLHDLPAATHAFDHDEASDPRFRFHPEFAAEALAAYAKALRRDLVER